MSKDASIRLWGINGRNSLWLYERVVSHRLFLSLVRYQQQEDPKMLRNFSASGGKPFQSLDLAPNGKVSALFLSSLVELTLRLLGHGGCA